jgi:hypothetical protein
LKKIKLALNPFILNLSNLVLILSFTSLLCDVEDWITSEKIKSAKVNHNQWEGAGQEIRACWNKTWKRKQSADACWYSYRVGQSSIWWYLNSSKLHEYLSLEIDLPNWKPTNGSELQINKYT